MNLQLIKRNREMKKLKILDNIAQGINSVPCPLCGGNHRVNLALNSTHSFAQSSGDWIVGPSGDKVFIEIEAGACEGFRERVARFVSAKVFGV